MTDIIVILVIAVSVLLGVKSTIKHFRRRGSCCGGGGGSLPPEEKAGESGHRKENRQDLRHAP